mmetsp:Transcript_31691/g.88303  ORF Transcript_31691/g.88303 Transcript_31691/m.88303 type:complete len:107 (-) Transcript_31691:111-431(-)
MAAGLTSSLQSLLGYVPGVLVPGVVMQIVERSSGSRGCASSDGGLPCNPSVMLGGVLAVMLGIVLAFLASAAASRSCCASERSGCQGLGLVEAPDLEMAASSSGTT